MLEITVIKQELNKPWISMVGFEELTTNQGKKKKKKRLRAEIKRLVCKYEASARRCAACARRLVVPEQRGINAFLRDVWFSNDRRRKRK